MAQVDQHSPSESDAASVASFGEQIETLRQSLAESDTLATGATPPTPTEPEADELVQTFRAAPPARRMAYLLHALDSAIAALDLACLLADEFTGDPSAIQSIIAARQRVTVISQKGYHATRKKKYARYEDDAPASAPDEASATLFEAYTAFRETQARLQGVYHYRNALAHYLRLPERELPTTPEAPQETADRAGEHEAE